MKGNYFKLVIFLSLHRLTFVKPVLAEDPSLLSSLPLAYLSNVMCNMNACKTCHYSDHSCLRNARPVSNFLLKCLQCILVPLTKSPRVV